MQANADATLRVTSNLTNLTSSGGPVLAGGVYIVNNGAIQISSLGTGGGELVANLATIVLNGSAAQIIDAGNNNALSNIDNNVSGASLTVKGGNNFSVTADASSFTNFGLLVIAAGSSFSLRAGTQFAFSGSGTTQVDGQLNAFGVLYAGGPVLTGIGVVNGAVTNLGGEVIPGDNGVPGALTINGEYSQPYPPSVAPASLDISIGSAGSSQLNVGSASLANTVRFTSYGGFSPAAGATFDFMNSANGITGAFTVVDVSRTESCGGTDRVDRMTPKLVRCCCISFKRSSS